LALEFLAGQTVYLDTNIVIYALEGFESYRSVLLELLNNLDQRVIRGVTSELTLSEVLVKPLRDGNEKRIVRLSDEVLGSARKV
jgi:predicted nucleic acid-binding protein